MSREERTAKEIKDWCSQSIFDKTLSQVEIDALKGPQFRKKYIFQRDTLQIAIAFNTAGSLTDNKENYLSLIFERVFGENNQREEVLRILLFKNFIEILVYDTYMYPPLKKKEIDTINSFLPKEISLSMISWYLILKTNRKKILQFSESGSNIDYDFSIKYYFEIPNSVHGKLAHEAWLGDKESKQVLKDLLEEKGKKELFSMSDDILFNIMKYDLT